MELAASGVQLMLKAITVERTSKRPTRVLTAVPELRSRVTFPCVPGIVACLSLALGTRRRKSRRNAVEAFFLSFFPCGLACFSAEVSGVLVFSSPGLVLVRGGCGKILDGK